MSILKGEELRLLKQFNKKKADKVISVGDQLIIEPDLDTAKPGDLVFTDQYLPFGVIESVTREPDSGEVSMEVSRIIEPVYPAPIKPRRYSDLVEGVFFDENHVPDNFANVHSEEVYLPRTFDEVEFARFYQTDLSVRPFGDNRGKVLVTDNANEFGEYLNEIEDPMKLWQVSQPNQFDRVPEEWNRSNSDILVGDSGMQILKETPLFKINRWRRKPYYEKT